MRFRHGAKSAGCRTLILSMLAIALPVVTATPGTAGDSTFALPTVDYSADMVRDTSGGPVAMKIFRTPDKSRTEMLSRGHAMISIVDRTKKEAISLDPEKHPYTKMDLSQSGKGEDPVSTGAYNVTLQGKEDVGGIETKKYSYEGTTNEIQMKGTVWMTGDNIPVRSLSTVVTAGQTISVRNHLENLKVQKLDPNLFEVPSGYALREMPGPGRRQ